jgi:hypothetical protein
MSDEMNDEANTIRDLTERGREKLALARSGAQDAVSATARYVRAHPWIAVAGAAVVGGAICALTKHGRPQPKNFKVAKKWLDEAYAKLPSQKQVQAVAESAGLPDFLKQLQKKLHFA